MRISQNMFHEKIEEPWSATFEPPYVARAERRDHGNTVGLAVFKDGEKLFDAPDLPSEHVLSPGMLVVCHAGNDG